MSPFHKSSNYVSRRNNLVLRGIREQNGEIYEQLVPKCFKDQLKLDDPTITAMKFIRVHRLGKIIPRREVAWNLVLS